MKIYKGMEVKVIGPDGSYYVDMIAVALDESDSQGWVKLHLHEQPSRDVVLHVDNLEQIRHEYG